MQKISLLWAQPESPAWLELGADCGQVDSYGLLLLSHAGKTALHVKPRARYLREGYFCLFEGRVSCSLGWLPTCYVVKGGLQLLFLSLLVKCWARCQEDSFQTGQTPTLGFGAQVGRYLGSCPVACSGKHSICTLRSTLKGLDMVSVSPRLIAGPQGSGGL